MRAATGSAIRNALRRRHLRRGPCQGKIVIGPECGFKHDPGNTNVSVLRQFSRKANAAPSHFAEAVAPSGDRVAVIDHHDGSAP
jgi:hypothetical protein